MSTSQEHTIITLTVLYQNTVMGQITRTMVVQCTRISSAGSQPGIILHMYVCCCFNLASETNRDAARDSERKGLANLEQPIFLRQHALL